MPARSLHEPCGAFRARSRGAALFGLIAAALFALAHPAAADDNARLKQLVETIATGDEVESAAATEQLIELMTAPLAEAIGSLEQRSVQQQVRLCEALARLDGALRMRVFRLDLPAEDRDLFDRFASAYPELVRRAFDGNYRVRIAAVHDIPLEPDTGAGVLLAAKVNDEDADVARAALDVAATLHDRVVARNLIRYIRDATATVRSGYYGPRDQDLARVVAVIVYDSIRIIGAAGATDGAPDVIDALRYFGRTKYWNNHQRAGALRVLGRLSDRRADPTLLAFIDDENAVRWRSLGNGKRLTETVGDVAARAFMRIHNLQPADFGMSAAPDDPGFTGYLEDKSRREGRRKLLIWRKRQAATQPAPAPQAP